MGSTTQRGTSTLPASFPLGLGRFTAHRGTIALPGWRGASPLPVADEPLTLPNPGEELEAPDTAEVSVALAALAQPTALDHPTALDRTREELSRWRDLLPALERELARDLKQFRRTMRARHVPPDYLNHDVIPSGKSGAWEVLHQARTTDGTHQLFTMYVRRSTDQFAVNENASRHGLCPLFTQAFPWDPPTADDLRDALHARLLRA